VTPRSTSHPSIPLIALLLSGLILLHPLPAAADELLVFAAASLSEVFTDLGADFSAHTPDTRVVCNFAGSQILATQIERGAPADLFAAANTEVMAGRQRQDAIEAPILFAGNRLVLIVSRQTAAPLADLRAAAAPGRLLAIGTAKVPVGAYTRTLLQNLARDPAYGSDFVAAFNHNVVSEETNVKAIAAKVALGEVDAGIVYRTDLTPQLAAKVVAVPLPQQYQPTIRYPIAILRHAAHPGTASRFLHYLLSPAGREILRRHGFSEVEGNDEPAR
jgi:molybdate transport system substrate-binding protein